ncbi:Lrp/AsnC family transcriptional regulator [Clostridium gasigenes]|nr:Lrp/AsnC family transcriptional regulator [Clostridium gasigenes]
MKMDNTDIKILKELQQDSRLSIRELSKKVNLYQKLKSLLTLFHL